MSNAARYLLGQWTSCKRREAVRPAVTSAPPVLQPAPRSDSRPRPRPHRDQRHRAPSPGVAAAAPTAARGREARRDAAGEPDDLVARLQPGGLRAGGGRHELGGEVVGQLDRVDPGAPLDGPGKRQLLAVGRPEQRGFGGVGDADVANPLVDPVEVDHHVGEFLGVPLGLLGGVVVGFLAVIVFGLSGRILGFRGSPRCGYPEPPWRSPSRASSSSRWPSPSCGRGSTSRRRPRGGR